MNTPLTLCALAFALTLASIACGQDSRPAPAPGEALRGLVLEKGGRCFLGSEKLELKPGRVAAATIAAARGKVVAVKGAEKAGVITVDALETLETFVLRGLLIKKPWTKSAESYRAGGSEYYVLDAGPCSAPKTAKEGPVLSLAKHLGKDSLASLAGKYVELTGIHEPGRVKKPDPRSQHPMGAETMRIGAGVKVFQIAAVTGKLKGDVITLTGTVKINETGMRSATLHKEVSLLIDKGGKKTSIDLDLAGFKSDLRFGPGDTLHVRGVRVPAHSYTPTGPGQYPEGGFNIPEACVVLSLEKLSK